MQRESPSTRRILVLVGLVASAGAAMAGPLSPPAGPIVSSHKTLTEVEPRVALSATSTPGDADSVFKITQPGSYYLTGNLNGQFGKMGIEIALASQGAVTIDLGGFELIGGSDTLWGIAVTNATPTRVNLRSGTIRFWDEVGANFPTVVGATIEDVRFLNNFGGGLVTTRSHVINCEASSNTGHGMSVDDGSIIEGCVARLNGQHGVYADVDGTVVNCELSGNLKSGVTIEYQGRVVNTNAANNGEYGIGIPRFGSAEGCTLTRNTMGGLYAQHGLVRGCTATENEQFGFNGSWTHFESCVASETNGTGMYLNGGSTAIDCLVTSSVSHGIDGGGGVQVINCKVQYSFGEGIRLSLSDNTIRGNTCIANATSSDGAGIHLLGADSVIEGNRVTGTDRGIDIDGAGNVIIGNWCSGNTINWQFVANNVFGPIVDRSAPGSGAVNGNAAAGTLGTSDPHANVTY